MTHGYRLDDRQARNALAAADGGSLLLWIEALVTEEVEFQLACQHASLTLVHNAYNGVRTAIIEHLTASLERSAAALKEATDRLPDESPSNPPDDWERYLIAPTVSEQYVDVGWATPATMTLTLNDASTEALGILTGIGALAVEEPESFHLVDGLGRDWVYDDRVPAWRCADPSYGDEISRTLSRPFDGGPTFPDLDDVNLIVDEFGVTA